MIASTNNEVSLQTTGVRNVYVQYVDKKEKYNYTVPTSIKFLNKDIAVDVFGFMPNYVNYDFPQEGNFNPKYYLPFQ